MYRKLFPLKQKGTRRLGGKFKCRMQGQTLIGSTNASLATNLSNSRNQYEMFSSPLFEVVLLVLEAK